MMFGQSLDSHRTFKRLAKALTRLRMCAGWSDPLLVAHTTILENNVTTLIISDLLSYLFITGSSKTNPINRLMHPINGYCRFGNIRENLIFANNREFDASRIQSSSKYWLTQKWVKLIVEDLWKLLSERILKRERKWLQVRARIPSIRV